MKLKEDLHEEISEIWNILIFIKENYAYSRYLHKPRTQEELEYINGSSDFQYFRHILWRMCIIDLSKLFSNKPNERFDLKHLLNKLKYSGHYRMLQFDTKFIDKWEGEIELRGHTIKKILKLRDKVYAHSDGKMIADTVVLNFEEIEPLINLVEDIIRQISSKVFETYTDIDYLYFNEKKFNMVSILAKERENRLNKLFEEDRAFNEKYKYNV